MKKYLLRALKLALRGRTDCRDFGRRAAELLVRTATKLTPQMVQALSGTISQNRTTGALCILGKWSYAIALDSRPLPMEYRASLHRGAARVFDAAIADALNLTEPEAIILYDKTVTAIRASLLHASMGRVAISPSDRQILAQNILQVVDPSYKTALLPAPAVDLIDRFFRLMTRAVIDSLDSAVFKPPGSLVEQLLHD